MPGIDAEPRPVLALKDAAGIDAGVVLLGLDAVDETAWGVLAASGLRLIRAVDGSEAVRTLGEEAAQVVLADIACGRALIPAVRAQPRLAAVHVIVCSPADRLRAALDAGADDVIRIPFEPEVLAARVAAGLRAARLRANEALLRSLVANIPGAVYRCAYDADWTMLWLSDGIETISGYAASDFIASRVRTFTSIIHPDDREQVARSVLDGVTAGRPFTIDYRIVRPDGDVRWVLERGQAQEAGDGRRWLDGAIFDITAQRAAEQMLREHEIVEAKLAEVQASRARILDAADRARREIERNLHDGAQQRLVAAALRLQLSITANRQLPDDARAELEDVLGELRTGLSELRDLAHGLHPAVLTDRGLDHALVALSRRAAVPVELRTALPERLPIAVESAAYFMVCEALTNVAKYADASHAWVTVEPRDGDLAVEIGDDGVGGVDPSAGSGLEGLRDRITAVGGTFEITSSPLEGTILRALLPVRAGRT
ncbi:MAG TPA: PAS domain-containing protein [Solirubrobacteraceae bacterium]|nr:PAS domain-containing protein [Solirubrobacteraceae bacterium]